MIRSNCLEKTINGKFFASVLLISLENLWVKREDVKGFLLNYLQISSGLMKKLGCFLPKITF